MELPVLMTVKFEDVFSKDHHKKSGIPAIERYPGILWMLSQPISWPDPPEAEKPNMNGAVFEAWIHKKIW